MLYLILVLIFVYCLGAAITLKLDCTISNESTAYRYYPILLIVWIPTSFTLLFKKHLCYNIGLKDNKNIHNFILEDPRWEY